MTAIASKTRERLLDVARQLFASNGVERTTMNDIATASDKGRRTIYTYFKNKKEIYDAVIEREADAIVKRFRDIVCSDLEPVEMLQAYIQLISYITLDHKRLERIRLLAVEKERGLFHSMIENGIARGVFDPEQGALIPAIHQMFFQGVDYCHLCDNYDGLGVDPSTLREETVRFLTNTIVLKHTEKQP